MIDFLPAGRSVDDRGVVTYVNGLPPNIKRMYIVENFGHTVRAFHGHLIEHKYFFVVAGTALVCIAPLKEKRTISLCNRNVVKVVLSEKEPKLLHIPAGHANGFKALESGTKLLVFSTASLSESKTDDYRFAYDALGADIWKTENR